ncbi:D-alanyl-D-alanine carboxypeptidase / D-alanyl-D-alanine-endopeptidase (penicillin-binding protein 4) [Kibdelosporangium aridum]|uniref:D-alanyl-D-alanine carboxypeptidase / D-alanyl-D-alanine-endopeptidase (Penicillin-binding protein 4) n=2 Tax=Kibdelosporangium aridum TaxID=2030 RepID=A0A1Y5XKC0_KIBAR|nr:D-alanyl-D-alanine carboxypeptidase / D-alanyl-D-alanine-endopeptidase (penicillin-binding protein 4) [Kibdelosporangium aridum]
MRIEPGKPPKPAQLKSDPPAGAATWFESPGEPPRALPMRIEPGKPIKTGDEPKPVTAKESEATAAEGDGPVAPGGDSAADAKEEAADAEKAAGDETAVADAEKAAGQQPAAADVEPTAQEQGALAGADREEAEGAEQAGDAPGTEGSEKAVAADPEPAVEKAVSEESAEGPVVSATESGDPEPEADGEPESGAASVEKAVSEESAEGPAVSAAKSGDPELEAEGEPESGDKKLAEETPEREAHAEKAAAVDQESSGESGEADTAAPESVEADPAVEAPQVEPADEETPDDDAELADQPGSPVADEVESAGEQTVPVQQVAKDGDAEPISETAPESPAASVEETAEGPDQPVAEDDEPQAATEPVAEKPEPSEQTAQVEQVDRASDAAPSAERPEPSGEQTAQVEPVSRASDAPPSAERPEPSGEQTAQVEQVGGASDAPPVVEREPSGAQAVPVQQASDAPPVGAEPQPPRADGTEPPAAEEPAAEETAQVERVGKASDAPSVGAEPEPPRADGTEPLAAEEPAAEETAQVQQVAAAQPVKEPEAPAAPTRDEPSPEPEPEKPQAVESPKESGTKPEPVGEKTVQMRPVAKSSDTQAPDEKPAATPEQPVTRGKPEGFGGLRRPKAPEQQAPQPVDETQPVSQKGPDDSAGPGEKARPAAADVGKTLPVQRPPKPPKPAEPRPDTRDEPVGEKTVQVRPVQKPSEKPPATADSWFSVPTRSEPTAPPTRPGERSEPRNRPVGDKTTRLGAPDTATPKRPDGPFAMPTRSQPMPPAPPRPKTPENLGRAPESQRPFAAPAPTRTPPPQRPKSPTDSPTRSQMPQGLAGPPTRTPPKRPETEGPTRHLPVPPPRPKNLETEQPKPQTEPEQPPPSNEDTHRALQPLPSRKRPKRLLVLVAIVAVIALGAGVVFLVPGVKEGLGFGGSETEAAVAPPPAPVAFTPRLRAPNAAGPLPTPQGVQSTLAGAASNPALGTLTGSVIDPATGTVLWEKNPTTPLTPASTTKVLTAAAALLKIPHSQQFSTKVVAGKDPGTVIIVGGGDGTLNSLPAGKNSVFPGSPRLDDLVAQVKAKGPVSQVFYDRTRYADDGLAPGVLPGDVAEGYISPISPLMMDGARSDPTKDRSPRSPNPAKTVATEFAKRLGATVAAQPAVTAPADAQVLGEVKSAPLTELVDQFLQASDNVLADVIAREVAKAAGEEASFAGVHKATLKVLSENGFDVTGAELFDGSGMSTSNKTPARLLAQVLAVAAGDGKDPRTAKLRPLLGGLPVAGGSGTLAGRFGDGQAASGRGWVRAKTGTLPLAGINSLAGVVLDADGRILVFALMTSQSDTLAARPALDAVAATLRSCGCK